MANIELGGESGTLECQPTETENEKFPTMHVFLMLTHLIQLTKGLMVSRWLESRVLHAGIVQKYAAPAGLQDCHWKLNPGGLVEC